MKRLLPALLVIPAALILGAAPATAQLNPGLHVARANDVFGGAMGVGGSLQLSFPLMPIDVFVAGEYFFPDCGTLSECSFMGGSADLHVTLPIPVLTPYGAAGLVYRRADLLGTGATTATGFGFGVGVNLGALVLGGYAEARWEIVDPDDQLVFRVGIRF